MNSLFRDGFIRTAFFSSSETSVAKRNYVVPPPGKVINSPRFSEPQSLSPPKFRMNTSRFPDTKMKLQLVRNQLLPVFSFISSPSPPRFTTRSCFIRTIGPDFGSSRLLLYILPSPETQRRESESKNTQQHSGRL